MKVKKEGNPCCGLVLRHRRYNGDVDFGVAARGDRSKEAKEKGMERNSEMLFLFYLARGMFKQILQKISQINS